ncbi:MAG TPA: TonB-dependent receptor [Longimicrobiaceae bacterium]|nr:TonB-dependent receptor [Longimicrobiaceae bacterium]
MTRISSFVAPALAALAGAAFSAGALPAQQAEPDTTPRYRLAPVVVEVFRTPLELERVPLSASVVGGERIREGKPGLALDEALRTIPGVQVDNRYNYALGERISIRGFGARTQFGVRGIRVVADGIPMTFADGQTTLENVDPGSLSRVEVIRGPASALYGNAAGGVILLRSLPPPPVPLRQELRATAGANGLLRLESRTGGRSGRAAYQLRASRLTYDGYREFSAFENQHLGGQLEYSLGGGELRVSGSYVDFSAQNPGSLSQALLEENPFQAFPSNVAQQTGKEGRQGQAALWLRQPLAGAELELSLHAQRRNVLNPIPNRIIDLGRNAGGVRALLRGDAALGARSVSWTMGADLDLQHDDRQNFVNQRGEQGALTLDQRERIRSVGAFTQLIVPLGETLSLMGSLRGDHFRFHVEDRFVTVTDPDDSGRREMQALSPALGVVWNPAPALGVFANLATAFETPSTTELANRPDGAGGFNPEIEPQRALSYELGVRGEVGALASYHLAAYRATIRNALIPFQVPDLPGRDFFRNAGSAVHQGIEAALGVAPLSTLSARVAYTYTDAAFRSYVVRGVAFDGNRIPGVAPHRLEASLDYRLPAGLFVGVEGSRVGEIPVNDANSEASPAYTLFHARAGLSARRVGWLDLAPFVGVNNLLDARYNTAVTINAFGNRYYEPGPGRALYLGVEMGVGR